MKKQSEKIQTAKYCKSDEPVLLKNSPTHNNDSNTARREILKMKNMVAYLTVVCTK
jgi:hypothetical protein